ncbi:protein mono-ADP-ribosyltransferase PARP15-like isoform X1 [Biomphalaria glabrata]|uniref:Poly [ADP-ribose] polymerase n=2 Tax=Biomphalaria glabrata TaxID=6526 RepID=A0A9W2ZU02_BIOGL|nr:protein mono-ADP-ribosyltransferase PARP15-like isoform X1 [Biomphalaria glabrata]
MDLRHLVVINQGDFFEFLLNDTAHWGICLDGDVCVYAGVDEVPDNAFIVRRLYRKWFPCYVVKVAKMQHLVLTEKVQRNSRGTEIALKAVKQIGSQKWKSSREFVDSCQVKMWPNLLRYFLLFLLFSATTKSNKSTPDENAKSDGRSFPEIIFDVVGFSVLAFIYYLFTQKRNEFLKVKENPFAGVKQDFINKRVMEDVNRFNSSHEGEAEIILTPEFLIMTGDVDHILACDNFVQDLTTKRDAHNGQIEMFGEQEFPQRDEGKALIKRLQNEHSYTRKILRDSKPETKLGARNVKDKCNVQCGWDFGNINVRVIEGDIERQKTDVIVSTVDKSLNLNFGTMASSVLRAAGDVIQTELLTRYGTGIEVGDFAQSSGGMLPCNYILHVCLPNYKQDNVSQILNTVSRLLDRAERLKSKSISFPALGTGILRYPSDISSEIIMEAIRRHAEKNKYDLQFVNIVVYSKDKKCFDEVLAKGSTLFNDIKRNLPDGISKDLFKTQSWPQYWDLMSEKKNLEVIALKQESLEYKEVEQHFQISILGRSVMINKIQRIQNKSLFLQFCAKKDELELHNPENHPNERKLFHGTSVSSVCQINETGFNRSFCGKNGTAYGKGVYFATESSYSLNYSPPDPHGKCYMYRARVLTGQFIKTSRDTKCPPKKPGTNRPYDSGGNINQGIFVIFHDAQMYPEYLITYLL